MIDLNNVAKVMPFLYFRKHLFRLFYSFPNPAFVVESHHGLELDAKCDGNSGLLGVDLLHPLFWQLFYGTVEIAFWTYKDYLYVPFLFLNLQ